MRRGCEPLGKLGAVRCGTVRRGAMLCGAVWGPVAPSSVVRCGGASRNTNTRELD